jgi:hypothetical protein
MIQLHSYSGEALLHTVVINHAAIVPILEALPINVVNVLMAITCIMVYVNPATTSAQHVAEMPIHAPHAPHPRDWLFLPALVRMVSLTMEVLVLVKNVLLHAKIVLQHSLHALLAKVEVICKEIHVLVANSIYVKHVKTAHIV